ncbi:SIS domain-containing protein [Amedibacterium intestinale]|uniref:SIS domain-containing protein n=1 Tax=Amedibacterium intestinale TaxID=2583452 RepID=UPI000E4F82D8|nr:SIS domain-containing protein [Amedibacterium intestinale]RHO22445.1 SIS domain-containing protein [Eubacterium sp. AM18-26]RHO24522.1 SIS domain-containing protein [Eubacterium sp. AM18-10LB-B]RHO32739.1 SIS domain-containing protein [Erysipelotrichaceae bacterium AM17-60]BBK62551.1 tagatose-6-phosphate ketose isomerase [Amedibacterium intestinale]
MIFGKDKSEWENLKGIFTAAEINQQPSTWRKTIKQIEDSKEELKAFIENVTKHDDYDIILTGAGTSEFVGNAIYTYVAKRTNFKTKSYGTTDIVATPENYLSQNKPTLLISYGRSGNSPESVGAVDVADEVCGENVYHLFITCNAEGALSKAAETRDNAYAINLTPETHDQSFAMTSSFSNMMLATLLCFSLDKLDSVKAELEDVISAAEKTMKDYEFFKNIAGEYDFNRIVYLGANCLKGIAQESQLKMLELTAGKVATMFDTPMGFRHGPKSIINDETLTVVYVSDDPYTRQYEVDLIKEMSGQRKGNKIVAIMNKKDEEIASLVDYAYACELNEEHDNAFLGFNYIVCAQILALFKSLSYGITPDNPCPTGEVNRVVKGVILHPYTKR